MIASAIRFRVGKPALRGRTGSAYKRSWLGAALVATVVTLAVASGAGVHSGHLKVSLDTIGTMAITFAAVVAWLRSRRLATVSSRLFAIGLVLGSVSVTILVALPALLGRPQGSDLRLAWALLNLTWAAMLAWLALTIPASDGGRPRARRLTELRGSGRWLMPVGAGAAIAVGGLGAAIAELVSWPGVVDFACAAAALALLAAAVCVTLRLPRSPSPSFGWWVALSLIIGAAAMVAFLVWGPDRSQAVSLGDVLGMASMVALGAGAGTELGAMRNRERAYAQHEERRRVASELHDGVAQELSYIAVTSQQLATLYPGAPGVEAIRAAAETALADCRTAIEGLKDSAAPTLAAAVESCAPALARRAGLELTLDVSEDIVTSAQTQHELLSIIREAISNTARHSGASRVDISLRSRRDAIVMRIADDGRGFDPGRQQTVLTRGAGFGLTSMRERAQRLGGDVALRSRPGSGTTIEVVIP